VAQGWKEIVYLDEYQGRNYIWSVPLTARGNEVQAGTPAPLFPVRLPETTFGDLNFLAVSRDGSRFFITQATRSRKCRAHPDGDKNVACDLPPKGGSHTSSATPPQRGWLPALAGRSEADY
jgi:hypothetical protein